MLKQFLSRKWIPYEEIGEYLIRDKENKILNAEMNGHMKAIILFVIGVIFITCLLTFTSYFKG